MSRGMKGRLDRLEKGQPDPGPTGFVLDWNRFFNEPGYAQTIPRTPVKDAIAGKPLLKVLRLEWARLNMPEPDCLDGVDPLAEMFRLMTLPTPTPQESNHARQG